MKLCLSTGALMLTALTFKNTEGLFYLLEIFRNSLDICLESFQQGLV